MPISIPFAQLQISPLPADAQQLSRAVLAGMWVNNEQRSFHTTHRDFVWEGGIGYPSNMLVVALSWTAGDIVADQEIVQYAERKRGMRARSGGRVQQREAAACDPPGPDSDTSQRACSGFQWSTTVSLVAAEKEGQHWPLCPS